VRFHDAGENYSLKDLTKELSSLVIIMLMSAEIDEVIRQDAPEDLREVRGEPPNIRSLKILRTGNTAQKKKELVRLHIRLHHIPPYRFTPLLRQAGFSDPILGWSKHVREWCKACLEHEDKQLELKVSTEIVEAFNDVVVMDIHLFMNLAVLHMMDVSSRLSQVIELTDREADTSISAFSHAWIGIFGRPRRLKLDRDGSFDAWKWREFADRHNMVLDFVPGKNKTGAGLIERHNEIIRQTAKRLVSNGVKPLDAVKESCGAKNEGLTLDGYVPVQLAFGWVPRSWDAYMSGMRDNIDDFRPARGDDVMQQALLHRIQAGLAFRKTLVSDEFRRAMNKY
jgi:hypothetical protein